MPCAISSRKTTIKIIVEIEHRQNSDIAANRKKLTHARRNGYDISFYPIR